MFQQSKMDQNSSFRALGFSDRVWKCLNRAARNEFSITCGSKQKVFALLEEAKGILHLADFSLIGRMIEHNPKVIQIVTPTEPTGDTLPIGLLAILPLNEAGFRAITTNTFSGLEPRLEWVCRPGEQPEGLYVWLIYMPGSFGKLLSAIASAIEPLATSPCPMFSRATNSHSHRLQEQAGFIRARDIYQDAANDLVVVLPVRSMITAKSTRKPATEIVLARNIEQIFQVFSVRAATYMAEQFCLYSEEFDGNDFVATHFLGTMNGDPAGCVRLRFFNGFAKLERLAVRAEYRHSRLAYQLVRAALEHCRQKGYSRILGHSRLDLVRFWRVFGFKQIEEKPLFAFANVQYAEILLEMDPPVAAIDINVDPMIILRPEGAWDRPGPFETSPVLDDPVRKRLLEERTRTIGKQRIAS
jgi:predicted GNAT family N-acyltransferase